MNSFPSSPQWVDFHYALNSPEGSHSLFQSPCQVGWGLIFNLPGEFPLAQFENWCRCCRFPVNLNEGIESTQIFLPEMGTYLDLNRNPTLMARYCLPYPKESVEETFLPIEEKNLPSDVSFFCSHTPYPPSKGFFIRGELNQGLQRLSTVQSDHFSSDWCEVSVETEPGKERQGWGSFVLAKGVEKIHQSGRGAVFITHEENIPAIALCRKIGFQYHNRFKGINC